MQIWQGTLSVYSLSTCVCEGIRIHNLGSFAATHAVDSIASLPLLFGSLWANMNHYQRLTGKRPKYKSISLPSNNVTISTVSCFFFTLLETWSTACASSEPLCNISHFKLDNGCPNIKGTDGQMEFHSGLLFFFRYHAVVQSYSI